MTGFDFVRTLDVLVDHPEAELRVELDLLLSHYRQNHAHVFLLQVGAFDGVSGDPLYSLVEKHHLRGVLIEPQIDVYRRLEFNYSVFGPRFTLVNAAIGPHDGQIAMYRIKPAPDVPNDVQQLTSLDKQFLRRHAAFLPNLESRILTESVPCITFETLFRELQIGNHHVNLLQIDAEGYDLEVLRAFDVAKRKPAIIQFEHRHVPRSGYEATLRDLLSLGYRVVRNGADTLAYRNVRDEP